jgi:hypothetical protein
MRQKDPKEFTKVVRAYSRAYRAKDIDVDEFEKQMNMYIQKGADLPNATEMSSHTDDSIKPKKVSSKTRADARATQSDLSDISDGDEEADEADDDDLIVSTLTDILEIIRNKRGRSVASRLPSKHGSKKVRRIEPEDEDDASSEDDE